MSVPRWSVVLGYGAVSAANQMLWLTFTPITTGAARHYGVSTSAIGWLAELFPLLYVVLAVPTGMLIDRHLRAWLLVGAALTAAGALLRLDDGYAAVLAGQVLVALAQPFVLNAVTRVSSGYLPEAGRAAGIAVSSAAIFGGMLVALLLGSLLGAGHLAALIAVQAAVSVLAAVWLAVAMRRPPGFVPVDDGAAELRGVRGVWRDPVLRRLTGLVCVGFGAFIALTTWLQALLQPAGVHESTAGLLLVAMVVAGVLVSATVPAPIARSSRQRTFLLVSVVGGSAVLVLLAFAPGVWTGLAAAVVLGALLLADLPVVLELAERRAGPAGGTATSLLWLAGNGAGLVAALVVQALVPHPAAAFAVLALLLVAGLPLLRGLPGAGMVAAPDPSRPAVAGAP